MPRQSPLRGARVERQRAGNLASRNMVATRRQIAWMTTTRTLMVPVAMRVPGCRDPRLRHPGCTP